LAANGTNCAAGNFPLGVDASGNSESCANSITGNAATATTAATATALAANGTNCSAGNFPLGVDASGNPTVQPALSGIDKSSVTLRVANTDLLQETPDSIAALVGSLLDVLALNERQGRQDVALFEVGKGYGRIEGRAHEWTRVAFVLAGNAEPPAWSRQSRAYDLEDGKGLVELLCERLHLPGPAYVADTRGYPFHPGRAMTVQARCDDGSLHGRVAELHPDAVAAWELRSERVIIAELAIGELDTGVRRSLHVAPIGRFPVMERDLAVIVDEARRAADIESVLWKSAGDLLLDARAFDVYRGAPLAATEKSVAYRLVFGSNERTLTEAEIDSAMAAVRAGLESEVQGRIRS